MPELPEVETLRRTLAPLIVGRRIDRLVCRRRDLRFPLPRGFANKLAQSRIENISRRGKYLLIELSKAKQAQTDILLIHLGMSGRLVFDEKALAASLSHASSARHDHVIFLFGQDRLIFHDPRRFGFMDLFARAQLPAHPRLARLGPEPLARAFTPKILAARLAASRVAIKSALLNQHLIVGLGNIYACEALHAARIAPDKPANELNLAECQNLHFGITSQLKRAIRAGGATLRDYLNANGQAGRFQHQFHVYGRAGQPCPACGQAIIRITQAARATFFCPACQKGDKKPIKPEQYI